MESTTADDRVSGYWSTTASSKNKNENAKNQSIMLHVADWD